MVSYGDTALWLTDRSRDDLGPLRMVRAIQASNQDALEWELSGEPQAFEEPCLYTRRRIRDRFDLSALTGTAPPSESSVPTSRSTARTLPS
jgi:hypothetical protein